MLIVVLSIILFFVWSIFPICWLMLSFSSVLKEPLTYHIFLGTCWLLDSLGICRPWDVTLRIRQYSSIVILSSSNIGLFLSMQLICNSKSTFLAAADDGGEVKVLAKIIFGGFFSLETMYICVELYNDFSTHNVLCSRYSFSLPVYTYLSIFCFA